MVLPRPNSTAALMAVNPSANNNTMPGRSKMMPMSTAMPTAIKNSPSNNPLKGSILASNSWRYSESANKTPAKNAPNDIDKPTESMAIAVTMTINKEAAVKISWLWVAATKRKNGRIKYRPIPITAAIAATARVTSCQASWFWRENSVSPNNGTRAISGITARS